MPDRYETDYQLPRSIKIISERGSAIPFDAPEGENFRLLQEAMANFAQYWQVNRRGFDSSHSFLRWSFTKVLKDLQLQTSAVISVWAFPEHTVRINETIEYPDQKPGFVRQELHVNPEGLVESHVLESKNDHQLDQSLLQKLLEPIAVALCSLDMTPFSKHSSRNHYA